MEIPIELEFIGTNHCAYTHTHTHARMRMHAQSSTFVTEKKNTVPKLESAGVLEGVYKIKARY